MEIAGVAAERTTPEDIGNLTRAAEAMERARGVEDRAHCGLGFHRVIAQATHNPLPLVLHDAIGDTRINVRRANHGRGGHVEALKELWEWS